MGPGYSMKDVLIFFGVLILAFVLVFSYGAYQNRTINYLSENTQNEINDKPIDSFLNASGLHWTHMPVTYSFEDNYSCGEIEPNFIRRAFDNIQKETNNVVSFKEVLEDGDITINCKKDFNLNATQGTYQVGDATITELEGNKILKGKLNFYIVPGTVHAGSCSYAEIEVHEILHTFGFNHNYESYNIMNPVESYCPTHLNKDILDTLLSTYTIN